MMLSMDCMLVHIELVSDMVKARSERVQKDKQEILPSDALYMLTGTTRS